MNGELGLCILCGNRVKTNHQYITAKEGYTHTYCLRNSFTGLSGSEA